jgi:hypothetical protein
MVAGGLRGAQTLLVFVEALLGATNPLYEGFKGQNQRRIFG